MRHPTRPDMGKLSIRPDPAEMLRALSLCAAWLAAIALLARMGYLWLERRR